MTVCVGAICESSKTIVLVSDRRLTTGGHTSSESSLKQAKVAHAWVTMVSGDDIAKAEDVIREVQSTLADQPASVGRVQAQQTLEAAWANARSRRGWFVVLSPYNLSVSEFTRTSRQRFGDAKFAQMTAEFEKAGRLDCDLLLCGFDEHGQPALCACDDDHGCRDFTRNGFVTAGSGSLPAFHALSASGFQTTLPLERAVYYACAAKFAAESASDVGEQTIVTCMRAGGDYCWLSRAAIKPIRELWSEREKQRHPTGADPTDVLQDQLEERCWQSFARPVGDVT